MLKNKKTTRRRDLDFTRLAGRAALASAGLAVIFSLASPVALAGSFVSSSARDGGTDAYIENNTFGTNRESGPAFWTDPATGERRFKTPDMPKKEGPEEIEILPVQPEVRLKAPAAKNSTVIRPGGAETP